MSLSLDEKRAVLFETIKGKKALVIIDVQNDFCPGGALAVDDGDQIIPIINDLRAKCNWDAVILTQDWHPDSHVSFSVNNPGTKVFDVIELPEMGAQVMWPQHCVQGSVGAEFHAALHQSPSDIVVRKGKNERVDSYSGFGDAHGHIYEKTELADVLHKLGVSDVFVVGLALDYCVAYTCKDAAKAGFNAFCVVDAARGISKDTIDREMESMRALGVHIVQSHEEVPTKEFEESGAHAAIKSSGSRATAASSGAAVGGSGASAVAAASGATTGGGASAESGSASASARAPISRCASMPDEKKMSHHRGSHHAVPAVPSSTSAPSLSSPAPATSAGAGGAGSADSASDAGAGITVGIVGGLATLKCD